MTEPITLHGGFYDAARNAELAAELGTIAPQGEVMIDLASTEYLDCSSLGLMIGNLRRWKQDKPDLELRLTNVNAGLLDVMHLLQLDGVFLIGQEVRE